MQYKRLLIEGHAVSVIGLGLAALGRPGYINLGHAADLGHDYDVEAMRAQTWAVLDAARAAGVNYFDAARSYGRAETFLGEWLRDREIAEEAVFIGSKWGYIYTAGWQVEAEQHEVKRHTVEVLRQQREETRAALGSYLRLYQIHSATLESGVLENTPVLTELARMKRDGLYIGLSLSGAGQSATLRKALELRVDGSRLFDTVQATWNLLERSAEGALAEARSAGMVVLVKEALANGRLTPRNTDPAFADEMALLRREAKRLHTSIDALALRAALAQPWADIVLSGATTVEQFESNVQATAVGWDDEAEARLAALAEPGEVYWQTRSRLAWN